MCLCLFVGSVSPVMAACAFYDHAVIHVHVPQFLLWVRPMTCASSVQHRAVVVRPCVHC